MTIDRSADRRHQPRSSTTRATGAAITVSGIWPDIVGSCRRTHTAASTITAFEGSYTPIVPEPTAGIYRGKAYDLHAIRRGHNVHFALEGSVRRDNGHLIVAVTVFDTYDDHAVWSHQYSKDDDQTGHDLILYGILRPVKH